MADEKSDEKGMEKRQEEKTPEEKSVEEKWQRDPLSTLIWALIFIWAGLVLLAANMGWLDPWLKRVSDLPGLGDLSKYVSAWPIVLVGAGVLILIEVVIRLLVPAYRRPVFGSLIFAVILIGIGMGDLWNWNIVWPLILIVIGLWVIVRGIRRSEG